VARHSLVPSPVVGSVDAEGGLAASGVALSPAAAFDIPAVLGAVAQRQPMIFGWSRSLVPGLAGGPVEAGVRVAALFICARRMRLPEAF
jgi:hypothetical protein